MNEVNVNGCGLPSVLTIIFVIAKLFGVIDWSWWVVFLPTIIPFAIWLLIFVGVWIWAFIYERME